MLKMKFKPRKESNPYQNTNYLACVPEYQHFLGMVASERAKRDGDMSCPFLYTYFGYRLSNIFYGGMYQLLKGKSKTSSTKSQIQTKSFSSTAKNKKITNNYDSFRLLMSNFF